MLYSKVNPNEIDPRLVMALKNIIVSENAGKVTLPVEWAVAIEKSPAYPPAKWTRRVH